MVKVLLLIFLATLVNAGPQIIPLKTFSSIGTTIVNGVEDEAKLYLASADDNSVLRNINISSGANFITLDQLNNPNTDGTPSFLLSYGLSVTTSNTDDVTANLTGRFYITTYAQAKDQNFAVCVVKDQHVVSTNAMKSTVVVLNTWLSNSGDANAPSRTSYVSKMNQSPNTNIYFQWGIPPSNWYEVTNNTFFRNGVVLTNGTTYAQVNFDNVEPMQINLDEWYFQVMGPNNIQIEKKYVGNNNYTVTATKTTGLIMNNGIYQRHDVNFMPDTTKYGDSGVYYAAYGEYGTIGVYLKTATGISSSIANDTNNSKDQWSFWTDDQAYSLTVNTTLDNPGTFFVQYFTFPGLNKPVTIPIPTLAPQTTPPVTEGAGVSTTTVGTSTKGSGYVYGIQFVFMIILEFMLF